MSGGRIKFGQLPPVAAAGIGYGIGSFIGDIIKAVLWLAGVR